MFWLRSLQYYCFHVVA